MNKKISKACVVACLLGNTVGQQEMFLSGVEQVTDAPVDPLAWRNANLTADDRASLLVKAMTWIEKAQMLSRNDDKDWWTGSTYEIERLKVPMIHYNDGPQGFRDNENWGTTTAWPSTLTFSQTWDKELIYEWGQRMGKEYKDKGAGLMLGPSLNVMRIGQNGRSFEYISGEDPIVGAALTDPLIRGIQSNGVMANIRHYANNNQETNRADYSANIDERTQMEMYYPPFQSAVEAGVGSVSCAQNMVNHIRACGSNTTLNHHLRELMGFDGFVTSDWGAVKGRPKDYVNAGCDYEMPSNNYNLDAIKEDLTEEQLDQSVHRITKSFIKLGLYDQQLPDQFIKNVSTQANKDFARKAAEESTVLLKNEKKTLPLKMDSLKKNILALGNATAYPFVQGWGSSQVNMKQSEFVPPLWALADELGISRKELPLYSNTARACNKDNSNCLTYVGTIPSLIPNSLPWVKLDEETKNNLEQFYEAEYTETMIFAGVTSGEGGDRSNLTWNAEVLQHLNRFKNCGKVIGMVTAPGPLLLNNLAKVSDAILFNVMPGEKYGEALINILYGRVNPSAKLSFTMPNIENEQKMTEQQFPGADGGLNISYSEKHHFGYRWYDENKVTPAYEFGFGLSYTKFEYSGLKLNEQNSSITFTVKNVGDITGSEIAQVYFSVPKTENYSAGYRSPLQLKTFVKVKDLRPGQQFTFTETLPKKAFSIWSVKDKKWVVEPGTYKIVVGASSRDYRMSAMMNIKQ